MSVDRPTPHSPSRRRLLSLPLAFPVAWPLGGAASEASVTIDLEWADASRDRQVPVRLHLPAGQSVTRRPAPLVVFSHGLGGSRYGYQWLGSHWASHGIASLHVQHVGSDRTIWAERGNPLALLGRMHEAITDREAVARVLDVQFALDQLARSNLSIAVDTARVVVAGHSYGANTALLISGARIERTESSARLADPRVAAAILISAPPFHGEGSPEPIVAAIRIPTLHVTATEDVIRVPGFFSDVTDRIALFEAMTATDKTLAVFAGGAHSMFTDRTSPGGEVLNRQVKLATRELAVAFAQRTLLGSAPGLEDWPSRHAAIIARYTPSPVSRA